MSIIGAIFHRFVNPTADEGNAGETGPSEWNDSHDVTVEAPGASAFGDTVAEGSATSLARSDHRHSREANPITAHEAAADPHAGYVKENDANWTDLTDSGETALHSHAAGAGGAPTDADYLVGTANGGLSGEIVVGTSPGGELGGTWGSPTVDATHSGSTHAAAQAAAEATAAAALSGHVADGDPHAGYRLESADHSHASTGAQAGKLAQANTHETPDTDAGPTSLHHTIGTGANQASAGNHTHAGGVAFSGAQVKKASNATQALTTAVTTAITYDAEDYDVGGYHDNVTNNSRLTAPATGYYMISATVEFATHNTGYRLLAIRQDGTTNKYASRVTSVGSVATNMTINGVLYLTSGQYVEIMVTQTSGGSLNIGGGTDTEHCRASISFLGS